MAEQNESRTISHCIQTFDLSKLSSILQKLDLRKSVEIVNLHDEVGYTLLHSAAYYNTFKIAEYIINFFRRRFGTFLKHRYLRKNNLPKTTKQIPAEEVENIKQKVDSVLKDWINYPSRGEEGFFPLHFASFHGNVKLIKLFLQYGANLKAVNKQGINMMHVAAQGDQAYSLTFFKSMGVSLKEKDGEHSTPLHWACFAGSDTAIYYLLAWGVDINA